jgi:heme/copper-type cytochrome/quinol oxidase subunit 1
MALTDTRTESGIEAPEASPSAVPAPVSLLGSGDHKALGLVYIVAALLFGVVGWIVSALTGAHALGSGTFLSESTADGLFSASRIGLVLLVAVPVMLGLATYIVPLQVGANTVAFPRAAAAALWTWILSGGLLIVANSIDGGLDGGRDRAVDLGLLAIAGLCVALVLGVVCVITTAIALRTPGMRLDRVPLFTWAFVVGGSVWVLTLPILFGNVVLIYVDHHYGSATAFGSVGSQWVQVSWIASQPQVYALLIPVLGLVADVIATIAGVRQPSRNLMLFAIGAFGVLSVGAWAQTAFYPEARNEALWAAMVLLIVLPTLLVAAGTGAVLRSGKPPIKSPLLLAIVALLFVLLAVLVGALAAFTPLELRGSRAFGTGQFAAVLAAVIAGAAAGVAYWAPKMTGRMGTDAFAKLNVVVILGGGALASLPLIILGFSARFTGLADAGDALETIAILGDGLLALGALLTLLTLLAATRGTPAGEDPWGSGQSLEWACASPPPLANFGELPVVVSAQPLLDAADSTKGA